MSSLAATSTTTTSVVSAYGATGLVADVPKVSRFVGPFFLSSTAA